MTRLATEAIIETSNNSDGDSGGRIEGSRAASIDLPDSCFCRNAIYLNSSKLRSRMNEVPMIVTSCINCIAPGSLSATLALILIGAGVAWTVDRRKLAPVRSA